MLTDGRPYPRLPAERQLELINKAQHQNCESSWRMLLDQYSPAIKKHVRRWCTKRSDDAESVESELLLRFVNAVKAFDTSKNCKPSSYIFLALGNPIVLADLRGPIKVPRTAWRDHPEKHRAATSRISDLEKLSKSDRERNYYELYDLIESLPPRPRKIMWMRLRGYSLREIATEDDTNYDTFCRHYRNILQAMRELAGESE